jgi:putative transposase
MAVKFAPKIIDNFLDTCNGKADIFDDGGLLRSFAKAVLERVLEGEMAEHLGYKKHVHKGNNTGNSRNEISSKSLSRDSGEIKLDVPRDCEDSFEPEIIKKN